MTDETTPDEEPAKHVIEALSRVVRDLPAIGKDTSGEGTLPYSYRGIEAITREVAPLFAKHGIVFAPSAMSWERDEITVANKPWTDDRIMVAYTIYGPGGIEDCINIGPVPAVGRDNSDKGANKAMTQAFKYALLQVLCIADEKDDADGTTHERDAAVEPADPESVRAHVDRFRCARPAVQEEMKAWMSRYRLDIRTIDAPTLLTADAALAGFIDAHKDDDDGAAPGPEADGAVRSETPDASPEPGTEPM